MLYCEVQASLINRKFIKSFIFFQFFFPSCSEVNCITTLINLCMCFMIGLLLRYYFLHVCDVASQIYSDICIIYVERLCTQSSFFSVSPSSYFQYLVYIKFSSDNHYNEHSHAISIYAFILL